MEKRIKAAGVIALAGVLLPRFAFWLVLAPVIAFTVFAVVYSYFEYKKEEGKAGKPTKERGGR
jgi:uncharacterized membrane protein